MQRYPAAVSAATWWRHNRWESGQPWRKSTARAAALVVHLEPDPVHLVAHHATSLIVRRSRPTRPARAWQRRDGTDRRDGVHDARLADARRYPGRAARPRSAPRAAASGSCGAAAISARPRFHAGSSVSYSTPAISASICARRWRSKRERVGDEGFDLLGARRAPPLRQLVGRPAPTSRRTSRRHTACIRAIDAPRPSDGFVQAAASPTATIPVGAVAGIEPPHAVLDLGDHVDPGHRLGLDPVGDERVAADDAFPDARRRGRAAARCPWRSP